MSEDLGVSRAQVTSAKASLREVERRRSERLMITVPIQVEGVDRNGEKFREDTRTLVINREGARIYLKRPVAAGALLLVRTAVGHRAAMFRVVGPTNPPTGDLSEWGVECQESNCKIWGIDFPSPLPNEEICTALLECRRCHTVKLSHLSLVEHEVLGSSGLLVKECAACGRATPWGYNEPSIHLSGDEAGAALPSPESLIESRPSSDRRLHPRAALQLPIRVRSFSGAEEFLRTENVSRGGICFITDRTYEMGEILLITCPFEKGGHNIEIRGQVVRRCEMQGTGRRIYGICYER